MSTTTPIDKSRDEQSAPATLGDVLYVDKARDYISEGEWVRLVRSVAAGDQLALYDLYRRTHRLVFTLTVRVTRNRETAEEITVDVLHQVWQRAALYNPTDGTVLGWIMNLARSRALDRVRFETRQKRVDPNPHAASTGTSSPGLEEAVQLREQSSRVREALTTLTPAERQAIETTFFRELTHAEAAEHLNEPLGTVKTRIRSGLAKLREVLIVPERKP